MPGSKDYYRILGVSRDARDSEIKRAYRRAAGSWQGTEADRIGITEGIGIAVGIGIHGQELNATVPVPDRTPLFLDRGRI